jgi:hypothetical protein
MNQTNNKSKNIITRKIKVLIDVPSDEKEKLNAAYRKLYDWQNIAFRGANIVATNLYIQEKSKDLIYFHDDFRIKLADRSKDVDGVLNCSRENTTYRVLSEKFKNKMPASIFSLLNRSVFKYFIAEKADYYSGKRSLRNYKSNIPVPFMAKSIFDLRYDDDIKNFRFSLFKDEKYHIPFRTFLGRDRSNNKVIIERCINGEYKLLNSSIKIADGKIHLYLVVESPKEPSKVDSQNEAQAKLSFLAPLIVTYREKDYLIGDKESFIFKRLAIQQGLKRRQQKMKYNSGGRGRKNKTKGVEEFKEKEKNFVNTYTHNLSSELIKFCIENKIGKLEIADVLQSFEEAQEFPFVIRNWSFGSLNSKLEYKCRMKNIELIYS